MATAKRLDGMTGPEWLEMMFEFEYCDECGKDVEHHKAVPFLGHWFAACLEPLEEEEEEKPVRDCKFCQRFWAGVYAYALPIVSVAFLALCLGLYAVIVL